MTKTIIAVALALLATTASAADMFLVLPITSVHFNKDKNKTYNSRNYGLGVEVRCIGEDSGVAVGAFRNSLDKQASYAALDLSVARVHKLRLALLAGAVSGYERSHVFVAPKLSYEGDKYGADLTLIPAALKGGANSIGLSVRYKF